MTNRNHLSAERADKEEKDEEEEDMDEEVLRRLEESTRDANRLQYKTLRSILHRNARVPYLRRYLPCDDGDGDGDGDGDQFVNEFRKHVPISSYHQDYSPIIQKMADDGDASVLSFDPLLCFFYSSGTSSMKPKMVPFFDSKPGKASSQLAHQASSAILRRSVPPHTMKTNKILWFLYAGTVTETRSGVKVMAATAFSMQTKGPNSSQLFDICVSPPQVLLGSDHQQQMYCHLLCGLRNSDAIYGIRAPYAIGLVRAFRLLESRWEQLCGDIEFGSVTSEVTDSAMRSSVEEFLSGPRPDVANRIREICRMQEWNGILCKLWRELRYVACVTTGSMEQYYPLLKHYTGDKIPLLSGDYFASECAVGINMDKSLPPQQARFTILPTTAYFEFLPFNLDSVGEARSELLVDISHVKVGKIYEVVVTTYRGLYRYRLGDVVRVAGFHNSSPQVEFVTRAPKNANEIFTERDLMTAMESFQFMLTNEVGGNVMEYTSFVDLETDPKHLIVFVEVNRWETSQREEQQVHFLEKYCPLLEGCLGSVYKVKRANGDLGSLEISIVKTGSFDELMRMALEKGAPANQYKPPKILWNHDLASFLKSSIVLTAR